MGRRWATPGGGGCIDMHGGLSGSNVAGTPTAVAVVDLRAGVIGSDFPWLDCPACNALTWVITVTE